VTVVPYFPLPDHIIKKIVGLQLNRIRKRVQESYRAGFDWDPALVDAIASRCTEASSGARNVENILSRTLLPELSAEVLAHLAEGRQVGGIRVGLAPDGGFEYKVEAA
jgi:type VI secretion system protein VasG